MKRFLRIISIIVAILLLTVLIKNLLVIPVYNFFWPQFLSNNDIKASNLLTLLFNLLSLAVTAIIMPTLWKLLEHYQKERENYSYISIYSKKRKNLSGVKKKPIKCKNLYVDLRKRNQENGYRIIYATIENIGKHDIVDILVNEQRIPVILKCQQSQDLVLFIDKFVDNRSSNPSTDISIEYQDNLNHFYSIKYALLVDPSKSCASFIMKQKVKKIRRYIYEVSNFWFGRSL